MMAILKGRFLNIYHSEEPASFTGSGNLAVFLFPILIYYIGHVDLL